MTSEGWLNGLRDLNSTPNFSNPIDAYRFQTMNLQSPFTDQQVQHINQWQTHTGQGLYGEPVPCPNREDGTHGYEAGVLGALIATPHGMVCPHCSYSQTTVHASIAEPQMEFVALLGPGGQRATPKTSKEIALVMMAYRELAARGAHGASVMVECLKNRLQDVAAREAMPAAPLVMWTIYDRPLDFPQGFIARKWMVSGQPAVAQATNETLTDDSLDGLRKRLPPGLYQMPRGALDETQIVETWL